MSDPSSRRILAELQTTMPDFVTVLVDHRPARLRGRSLGEVLRNPHLQRTALLRRFSAWEADPGRMALAPPTLAFAVLGQARASGRLTPERESRLLRHLITTWAVTSALETARATTRSDVGMFVGQPTIWTDAPHPSPAPTHRNLIGGTRDGRHHDRLVVRHGRHRHRTPEQITVGGTVVLTAEPTVDARHVRRRVGGRSARCSCPGTTPGSRSSARRRSTGGRIVVTDGEPLIRATLDTSPLTVGSWRVRIRLTEVDDDEVGDRDRRRATDRLRG